MPGMILLLGGIIFGVLVGHKMNSQTAENWILLGIKSTKFSKRLCFRLFPINLIIAVISCLLFNELSFIIIVALINLIEIILSVILFVKWSAVSGLVSQATQILFFVINLDFINYSMYKLGGLFVWYELLIAILLQFATILIFIPIAINSANRYIEKASEKKLNAGVIAGSVAGLSYITTITFCKIFLTNASLAVVITIISILINLLICLLNWCIVLAFYRVYLIKRFKLKIDLKSI